MIAIFLLLCYGAMLLVLAVWGVNSALLTLLSRRSWGRPHPRPEIGDHWPVVTVQLPIYNERYVVERLIAAVVALDYPRDRLELQVLDDSTDETVMLARQLVEQARAGGLAIHHIRRSERHSFKAGNLRAGLRTARGELIAIFDADFVPPPDFLRRTVPFLAADPNLGCVHARWEHLNADDSPLTRAQRLLLDGQCVVEQCGRNQAGLPVAFTGSAGVWRRAAIEAAGGWHDDTLMEDLDLSYRAQLAGWRMLLLPELAAAGELPIQLTALRQQQFRWAKGSIQAARKLLRPLWRSALPLSARLAGTLHLLRYADSAMLVLLLLIHLPLTLVGAPLALAAAPSALAALGPLAMYLSAERRLRGHWIGALRQLPVLALLGLGLSVSNARAVAEGLLGIDSSFKRTPKFGACTGGAPAMRTAYAPGMEPIIWWEALAALYALVSCGAALAAGEYAAAVWLGFYAASCGLVAGVSIREIRVTQCRISTTRPRALGVEADARPIGA